LAATAFTLLVGIMGALLSEGFERCDHYGHGRSASKAWPIPMAARAPSMNMPRTWSTSPFHPCTYGIAEHGLAIGAERVRVAVGRG
jgi:hypothetical protein